jgi:excisionase family DNA binding protein
VFGCQAFSRAGGILTPKLQRVKQITRGTLQRDSGRSDTSQRTGTEPGHNSGEGAQREAAPRGLAMMIDRKTISIMKACELVGVSRRTIYNWIASGKVEYVRTAGGSVRIFVDTLWRAPSRSRELTKEAS